MLFDECLIDNQWELASVTEGEVSAAVTFGPARTSLANCFIREMISGRGDKTGTTSMRETWQQYVGHTHTHIFIRYTAEEEAHTTLVRFAYPSLSQSQSLPSPTSSVGGPTLLLPSYLPFLSFPSLPSSSSSFLPFFPFFLSSSLLSSACHLPHPSFPFLTVILLSLFHTYTHCVVPILFL